MAIVVKMPASEVPAKVTDIDLEFFNANIFDTEKDEITILDYEVNIDVGGKIAQLGSRLINGVAKKISIIFFSNSD